MSHHLVVPLDALSPEQRRRWLLAYVRRNEARAEAQRQRQDRREEMERAKQDTKPVMYVDAPRDGSAPLIVVGGGQHWYHDLQELARRRRESPRFRSGAPKYGFVDPNVALRAAVDKWRRAQTGLRTFHIPNNPLARGGTLGYRWGKEQTS